MNNPKECLEVKTDDTIISYHRFEPGVFEYTVKYDQSKGQRAGTRSREYTIHGPLWAVVVGESGTGEAQYIVDGEPLEIDFCRTITFIPPHRGIEIEFENLAVEYRGWVSELPVPKGFPDKAVAFNVESWQAPSSLTDLVELVNRRKDEIQVERTESADAVAEKARCFIHEFYDETITVEDVAFEVGLSPTVFSKRFKAAFGISPLKYRNILRVQDSVRHLLFEGRGSAHAGFEVGFEDLSRFNKNFKSVMEAVPSQFVFKGGR